MLAEAKGYKSRQPNLLQAFSLVHAKGFYATNIHVGLRTLATRRLLS